MFINLVGQPPWTLRDNKPLKHSRGGGRAESFLGRWGWRDVKLVTWKAEAFQKRSGQPVVGVEFFPSLAPFRKEEKTANTDPSIHSNLSL